MQRDELVKRANDLMHEYEIANATQKKVFSARTKPEQDAVASEIAENERRAKGLILESVVDVICIFARMADAMDRIAVVLEEENRGGHGVPKV